MLDFLTGKIADAQKNYIVLDINGIGFLVYVANPFRFKIGDVKTIYIFMHIREDDISLYGFEKIEEKDLFLRLIAVKGLGPKMALPMFSTGSVAGIIDAIDRENILYLTKFPKIGDKIARQIILDLKGKLSTDKEENNNDFSEVTEVLESLGYKKNDIKKVLPKLSSNAEVDIQVKEALKLMLK